MKTVDYQRFHDLAKRLMNYWCPTNNAVWTKIIEQLINPDEPWKGKQKVPVKHNARIIFMETRDRVEEFNLTQYIPETELASDATFAFHHPQGYEPEEGETVTNLRGQHFTCHKVRAIAPYNEPIFYILTLI